MIEKPQSAEIHPGLGFRIRHRIERPAHDSIVGLSRFKIPEISDCMNRLYTISRAITCLTELLKPLLGIACTVRVYPGDNLMVHKALDIAQPGDVVVIDANGLEGTAVLGDSICTKAKHRNIAGFVVDGFVRDIIGVRKTNLPVFARGVTAIGPLHRGPGEINFPIQCGGVVVHPGDVVLGDENGVVVVPTYAVGTLIRRLSEKEATEAAYKAAVARGEFSNAWVDRILDAGGCEHIE